ncbi:prostacyclin synthase [Colletotrichum higginsianum]|nr:prostacyclin synthase [Colletotrichum higginsianum]
MYVINNANLVQSAMRNKTLEFGARIEEIGRIMGVDPVIVKRLVKENAVEEISRVTVSALSGENLLSLNLNALKYIGGRFNEVKPGSPSRLTTFTTGPVISSVKPPPGLCMASTAPLTTRNLSTLFAYHRTYESGLGKLQYGWISKFIAGKALEARKKIVTGLVGYYMRKLDQGPTVSAVIKGRAEFWRSFGLSDIMLGAMDSLPASSTVNTAPSMFWLIVNVFAESKYLSAVRKEVEGANVITITQEGDKRIATVDVPELGKSCHYLVACYRETLRMENTVTGSRTVTSKDTTITDHETGREYLLKEGVEVQWSASVMHKKSIWGEDSEKYNPRGG